MSYPKLLVAFLAALLIAGTAIANDNPTPEGLFLYTLRSGLPESSYVAAYVYDIYSANQRASHYITGYTGPNGQSEYPPNYNTCRFARQEIIPPGYAIPCDGRYRWRFYAYKEINGTTYYSDWSKEMIYSPDNRYDYDFLYLTRTSPPDPIPPYYTQE
ncbi:MAG: hypothetical protein ABIK48_01930 [candidate division WOR-3 bacterium]